MNILISGKPAVLKKGSSFDYIAENRFFTGADSYTLSITFPLKDCPKNLDIFGHINRKDCDLNTLLLDCEIHAGKMHRYGAVNIVEISESEVKVQFLEGRSVSNFYTSLDEIYINELNLPDVVTEMHGSSSLYLRSYAQQKTDQAAGGQFFGYVCLPWVNNTSGNIQNKMNYVQATGSFQYEGAGLDPDVVVQPFLVEVIRQILSRTGYSFDISAIEQSYWKDVIVCNALPLTWELKGMKYILPHWTVLEFLEQVELFLDGEFVIDNKGKTMVFSFNSEVLDNISVVTLDNVVDSHSVEITSKEKAENTYSGQRNLRYADCSHQMWKFYSCNWLKKRVTGRQWANIAAMKAGLNAYLTCVGECSHIYYKEYHYCVAEDTTFVLRCHKASTDGDVVTHYMRYQPINSFGERVCDEREDADADEISIVPVCIDETDNVNGDLIFMECGEYGSESESDDEDMVQTHIVNVLTEGEKDKSEEYFDKLYVGFYTGNANMYAPRMPRPFIDAYETDMGNLFYGNLHSLRLHGIKAPEGRTARYKVDQSQKFTFTFLSDEIPDVKDVFMIHGKKYLAEKITATISEEGLSQKMKMVTFRIVE